MKHKRESERDGGSKRKKKSFHFFSSAAAASSRSSYVKVVGEFGDVISICPTLVFLFWPICKFSRRGGAPRWTGRANTKIRLRWAERRIGQGAHTSGKANKQLMLLCKFMPLTQISIQPKFENNLSLKSHFGFLFLCQCVCLCVCVRERVEESKRQAES